MTIWEIGSANGIAAELVDTHAEPLSLGEVTWDADAPRSDQRWPRFHASEADPAAGYRRVTHAIRFSLADVPPGGCDLVVDHVAVMPRLADLEVAVNGRTGVVRLTPQPIRDGHVELRAGLQAAISAVGQARIPIDPRLLRPGSNRIELRARDRGEVIRVPTQAIAERLDRMATAAGVVYRRVALELAAGSETSAVAWAKLLPSTQYRREENGLAEECVLQIRVAHAVEGGRLQLYADGATVGVELGPTSLGDILVPIDVRDGETDIAWSLAGRLGHESVQSSGTATRRPRWTVHVAPGVHTDIGYTHRPAEIGERLARNIDTALRDRLPYHLDSAWALEHFLATRSDASHEQAADALAQGWLGVSAIYADVLTQFAGLEDIVRNRLVAEELLARLGSEGRFVAVVDVASLSGSLPAILAGSGIDGLVHASNQDRGPFRLASNLHAHNPWRWQGTAGGEVTVWLAKAYCELRKVCGSPPTLDSAARGLGLWLDELETAGSIRDATALLYGQEADNTDLDPEPIEFVRRWNERYAYPRLVLADPSTYFDALPAIAELPRFAGDGGAWWEDGVGAAPGETALARSAQATLPAAERMASLAAIHDPTRVVMADRIEAAWRSVLLFDEHTWGAFLSATDPAARLQRDGWEFKARVAHDAAGESASLLHAALAGHALQWPTEGREVVVFNPNSWRSSGPVEVEVRRDEAPVIAGTGQPVAVREVAATATQRVIEMWVDDIEGLSYRRFPLVPDLEPIVAGTVSRPLDGPVPVAGRGYRAVVGADGSLASWHDADDEELVDATAGWRFGHAVVATAPSGTRLDGNVDGLPVPNVEASGEFALEEGVVEETDHATVVRVAGRLASGSASLTWTFRRDAAFIDLALACDLEPPQGRSALYVAFPFALPEARVRSDSQLGWVDWGSDTLPGACLEWLPLQSAIWLDEGARGAVIASPDVPLFCAGDVVRGRWRHAQPPLGGHVLSFAANNHWHTNYPAWSGGRFDARYRLFGGRVTPSEAYRIGWEARRPMAALRQSLQQFRRARPPYGEAEGRLAVVDSDDVVLTALKPAARGAGWIARLQEIGGRRSTVRFGVPPRAIAEAWRCDHVERQAGDLPVRDGHVVVELEPWELVTVGFSPNLEAPDRSADR